MFYLIPELLEFHRIQRENGNAESELKILAEKKNNKKPSVSEVEKPESMQEDFDKEYQSDKGCSSLNEKKEAILPFAEINEINENSPSFVDGKVEEISL